MTPQRAPAREARPGNDSSPKSRMPEGYDELDAGIRIDKLDLDTAFVQHSELFSRVARAYALAVSLRDQAKAELEIERAEADSEIRKTAARAEEKLSEPLIANRVTLFPRVREAQLEFFRAKEIADLWGGLKDSYEQRGYALKDLSGLYQTEYYQSTPSKSSVGVAAEHRTVERTRALQQEERERRRPGR